MKTVLMGILAIVLGAIIGGMVNMGIIMVGPSIIPLPEGVDPTDMESLKANMENFKAIHFITPFLAHALGTLVGAIIATLLARKGKMWFALGIGLFFLAGGFTNVMMLPAPMWFNAVDLIFAYIPMGYLGFVIARRF